MLKLLERRAAGSFENLLAPEPKAPFLKKPREHVNEALCGDPQDWLDSHISAFDGPHQGRPWVKVLRQIARGEELKLAEFVPTKA